MKSKLFLALSFIVIFAASFFYFYDIDKGISKKLVQSSNTINKVDKVRFSFKVAILTQKAISTYLLSIDKKEISLIDDAIDYYDSSIGFINISYTKDEELANYVIPKIEYSIEQINKYKLNIDDKNLEKLIGVNNSIVEFIQTHEQNTWTKIQNNYIDFTTNEYKIHFLYKTMFFILIGVVFLLFIFIFSRLKLLNQNNKLNKKLELLNNELEEKVELKTKELQDLNRNLEKKVTSEVEKNRQQEIQLHEQAKMAALGDMIANIAHQWRQPLSIISTAATGMKLQKEFNNLKDEEFYENCDNIARTTQYLSKTIDTFRNFIKEKKVLKEVVLQERIEKALEIVDATLSNNHIKLINKLDEYEPINITMVTGELSQVIINIVNNAKDAIKENEIENPWVKIELEKSTDMVIISIEDNGGGIPKDILSKIFDPYFTTKHQSQGTGLGLHMSYKIVTESLKGKIYVKNTDFGAKFFIELPLNQ